jgi:hypothetical protein
VIAGRDCADFVLRPEGPPWRPWFCLKTVKTESGVPQSSVLGPTLFLTYNTECSKIAAKITLRDKICYTE